MRDLLAAFRNWLDELFSERDEFGLTDKQRAEILTLAKRSQTWRDAAEELACHAYGLKTSQFYLLLHRNGISTK